MLLYGDAAVVSGTVTLEGRNERPAFRQDVARDLRAEPPRRALAGGGGAHEPQRRTMGLAGGMGNLTFTHPYALAQGRRPVDCTG